MSGIPQILMPSLRKALMKCDEFRDSAQLRAVFETEELKPWRDGLIIVNNLKGQVDITISYLADKHRTSGENVLILLLRILANKYDPPDERYDLLNTVANQLEWLKKRPSKPESNVLEANPAAAQMLWIADAQKMLACARSVARVEVPRYIQQKKQGRASTGTAWLIAPGLAVTCWHVIENRGNYDSSIEISDLQMQIDNALLTFDYTVAGKGLQYSIAALMYPGIETQWLDYAVLRLSDRDDAPLRERGFLNLDIDAPLTTQTSLYIIQHPLGQPQQSAGDTYERPSVIDKRIFYNTPTEPGTSGAPVFNRANWHVTALHNGENQEAQLREGTLIKPILEDLKQHQVELYDEIIAAQDSKTQFC